MSQYPSREMERQLEQQKRRHILNYLEEVIFMATGDPVALRDHGDYIIIDHGHGTAQSAWTGRGSYLEMAYYIMKAALHGEYFDYDPSKEDETDED